MVYCPLYRHSFSPDPFQWSSLSDVSVQDKHHAWQTGPELPEDDRSALGSSLADLLALYGARGDGKQPPPPTTHSARRPSHAVTGERDGNREAAAGRTRGKQKRNFSLGVAGKCCNHGCTKNDIGRVCWGARGWGGGDGVKMDSVGSWRDVGGFTSALYWAIVCLDNTFSLSFHMISTLFYLIFFFLTGHMCITVPTVYHSFSLIENKS